MVGSELARIDWSTEPMKTGSIMLVTMTRRSRWDSGSGSAGGAVGAAAGGAKSSASV